MKTSHYNSFQRKEKSEKSEDASCLYTVVGPGKGHNTLKMNLKSFVCFGGKPLQKISVSNIFTIRFIFENWNITDLPFSSISIKLK